MSDLYITFFEIGLKMVKSNGKLCFITPNSYFNSIAGNFMREYIINHHLLTYIKNFGHYQVFNNITTYCCITILDKQNQKDEIIYEKNDISKNKLKYSDFYINNLFCFEKSDDFKNIINYNGEKYCCVKNGCATLFDSFFINSDLSKTSKFVIPIIKASTNKKYKCFYPYDEFGKIIPFDILVKEEPITAQYLLDNKELLTKRAIDKPEYWYAFGRTQAIADTYKTKFIINTLYKDISDIRVDLCEEGCAVYSGLYILTDINIEIIKKILISKNYLDYVKTLGKYKSGGYYTVNSKEVEKFINYEYNKRKFYKI
jgi:adenine-specific DNA-methyltransferase